MKPTTEKKNLTAREYNSPSIDAFLALEDPAETARTETRMMLAIRIYEAMKAKAITKKELAAQLNQHQSAVTKWLSGKHHFTTDTLTDIGRILNIDFFAHEVKPMQPVQKLNLFYVVEMTAPKSHPTFKHLVSNSVFKPIAYS
jgi:transcriptional regulator with XRE-family HTH domain